MVIGLVLIAMISITALGTALFARRMSEEAIIQNAATSIIYGIVEQMKTVTLSDDTTINQLPSAADDDCGSDHVKVRVDNSTLPNVFLELSSGSPPESLPAATASAADVGATANVIGPFDLSQTNGVRIQPLNIDLWIWIEPDYQPDAMEAMTRVTLIYTYTINNGSARRTFRDCIRFVRAKRQLDRAS